MHDALLNEIPTITREKSQLWKATTINLLLFTKCVIGHLPSKLILTMYDKYTHKVEPSPPLLSPFSPLLSLSLPSPPLFLSCIHAHLTHRHWKLRCHLKSITMRTQKLLWFFFCNNITVVLLVFHFERSSPPCITIHYRKIHREFGIHWNWLLLSLLTEELWESCSSSLCY